MKKTFFLLSILSAYLSLPSKAHAAWNLPIDFNDFYNLIPTFKFRNKNLADIIAAIIPWIFVIAGLVLFFYLITAGFELMTSGGNKNAAKSASEKITHALIGFIIIFASFWIVQILQKILGLAGPF